MAQRVLFADDSRFGGTVSDGGFNKEFPHSVRDHFPLVKGGQVPHCYNCGGELVQIRYQPDELTGRHSGVCLRCERRTYYDVVR